MYYKKSVSFLFQLCFAVLVIFLDNLFIYGDPWPPRTISLHARNIPTSEFPFPNSFSKLVQLGSCGHSRFGHGGWGQTLTDICHTPYNWASTNLSYKGWEWRRGCPQTTVESISREEGRDTRQTQTTDVYYNRLLKMVAGQSHHWIHCIFSLNASCNFASWQSQFPSGVVHAPLNSLLCIWKTKAWDKASCNRHLHNSSIWQKLFFLGHVSPYPQRCPSLIGIRRLCLLTQWFFWIRYKCSPWLPQSCQRPTHTWMSE